MRWCKGHELRRVEVSGSRVSHRGKNRFDPFGRALPRTNAMGKHMHACRFICKTECYSTLSHND